MNYILDVLIMKSDFDKVDISEQFKEWGGEKFPQNPIKYTYKSSLIFHENKDSYYQKTVGNIDIQNYVPLTLEGHQLTELESLINDENSDIKNNELLLFLSELYNVLDTFFVFIFRDEECIDEKYDIKNVKELVEIFCNSLRRETPRGFLIKKKKKNEI